MAGSSWGHSRKEIATYAATTSPRPHRRHTAASDRWGRIRALLLSAEMVDFLLVGGLGFSVVSLVVSHDLLGLTSRLADALPLP